MSATEPTRPAVPEYGEYASPEAVNEARAHRGLDPLPVAPAAASAPASAAGDVTPNAPVEAPVKAPVAKVAVPATSWDRSVSIALLVFGALATVYTAINTAALPTAMGTIYSQLSIDASYSPGIAQTILTAVLIGSHAILLALAISTTNARLRAGKTAFWAPLIAGAVAVLVTFLSYMAFMLSDPNLTAALLQSAS